MTAATAPQPTQLHHIRINAPAERVYNALTQAEELRRWFPQKVTSDPRVGGTYSYEFNHGCEPHTVEGKYLALVPHTLVSYSWHEQVSDDEDTLSNLTVTFRLEAQGDHTDLYLEETGFGAGAMYETYFGRRTNGWAFFFGNLKTVLEDGVDTRDTLKSR